VVGQINLPPYRGPWRPLDLVAIEIIFGCLFEVFRHVSQDTGTKTSAGDDIQPLKRTEDNTCAQVTDNSLLVAMKLICIMITSLFVGNHLRVNHQSALVSSRPLHRYLHL
jgi:hypothetical protein